MKVKIKTIQQIIVLIIIFIMLLSLNHIVLAAQDWSAVWEQAEIYGGGKVEYQNPSWPDVDTYISEAQKISEQELNALSGDDRLGFIKFVSAFIADNTEILQSDIQQYNDPNSQIATLYRDMESKINSLESSADLSDEENTYIEQSNIIIDHFNNNEGGFSSYEDFLANASVSQKVNARILGGYFDEAGNIVVLTEEQIDEITDKAGEEIDESNEASDKIDEMNKPEQSVLDRKPIGLLPEKDGDGQITVDETIEGAMDFVNSGQEDDIIIQDRLQGITRSLYNVLLVIAMVVAVVTGLIIAIKFMTSSVEGKAEVKKVLLPYVISCAVTFGAFAIWKLVVEILNNLE